MLGSTTRGAFGGQASASILAGMESKWIRRSWTLTSSGTLSLTSARHSGGMIQDAAPALTSVFSIEAERKTSSGSIRFGVSQSMRVESGDIRIRYPAARTPERGLIVKSFDADLECPLIHE